MITPATRSISTKLTLMSVLVSGVALLLACVSFFIYDQITFRQGLVHTLSAQAQIVGSNSVSALLFNDPQSATNTLSALRSSPNISSAGILTAGVAPFAKYSRDGEEVFVNLRSLPEAQVEGYWFGRTRVILLRKVLWQGRLIGFVYIHADLREIDQRLRRYALISLAVLWVSLTFALLFSSAFSKTVARPIVGLAETARRVTRDRDYSVTVAPTHQGDELDGLIDSFNEMLKEIQQRENELQKARRELEQRVAERTRDLVAANRELEAFSYSVSHDLRGPLDVVNGFAYMLLKNYSSQLDRNAKESLQNIRSAARRMSELIDDLLNLSRLTTSTMHREEIDLSAMAQSIMEELRRNAPERQVEFFAPSALYARADARLIRILMDNLLRNAWKYTSHHQQAHIELGSEKRDGRTVYFVKDDGSGFDQRAADRLFQPFQRLHSPAEFSGNGIGLATVRRIVQRHAGEVWAEGAVEKGAVFYFTLDSAASVSQ